MKFELQRVHYMPAELNPGVLYVSEEFGAAAHLCACGCGAKIRTPLGPTEWSFETTDGGPTLRPSVGNWQQPCQSHYWIRRGQIIWDRKWTPDEIAAGRRREDQRLRAYYESLEAQSHGPRQKLWRWLKRLFKRQ